MNTRIVIAVLSMGGFLFANAGTKPDFSDAANFLEKSVEERAFPGCTVCVGRSEKILWSDAFGKFDYTGNQSVSRRTIYDLASLTKVIGTTSVYMRLVALGKIRVIDPVGRYLPDFIEAAPSEEERALRKKIRIEHLLTHSGGIAGWKPFWKNPEINSYRKLLDAIIKTPLENSPGVRVQYSDLSMMLLGEIASRVGGKPLNDLEQELVFRPLKMRSTVRNPPPSLKSRIPPTEKWPDKEFFVHGIVHDENSRSGEGITGHAGLFSTAEDVGRLASELLRGLGGESELFPRYVVEDFFRERTFSRGRALGWAVSERETNGRKSRALTHTGFTGTSIRIYPEQDFYVVLLSNRVHPTRDNGKVERVRRQLAESVLEALQ